MFVFVLRPSPVRLACVCRYVEARAACDLTAEIEDGVFDAVARAEEEMEADGQHDDDGDGDGDDDGTANGDDTGDEGAAKLVGRIARRRERVQAAVAAVERPPREPVRLDAESFFPIFVSVVRRSGLRWPSRLGWLLETLGVGMRKQVGEIEYVR